MHFDRLRPTVICPASGYIKHDYLVPGGFYKEMWDWDGYFISIHLISRDRANATYLKYWALSFIEARDENGYVPGCITVKGLNKRLGYFPMKPFLAQGVYLAATTLDDFTWVDENYEGIKSIVQNREKTNFDPHYGLFFWDNAMQSGADNNVALSNDPSAAGSILACDINTFQLREYISLCKLAEKLGRDDDAVLFKQKSDDLTEAIARYHWSDEDESYWNVLRQSGEPVRRVTYSNFVPLVQNMAPLDAGRRMIRRYLWNEEHMLSPFGLRSLSRQDPDYNNELMIVPYSNWQGPIWPITNYLYFRALMNYGFEVEARQLAKMMMEICLRDIDQCGSMHENYHAETGEPLAPSPEHFSTGKFEGFVGWNLLVQNMQEEVDSLEDPLKIQ